MTDPQNFAGLTKDDLVGEILNLTAITYHAEFDKCNAFTARTMSVKTITLPSETSFASTLKVLTLWGIPRYASPSGLAMDADRLIQVVIAKDGNDETEKQFMLSSGMSSSVLEHAVPEQLFSTQEIKIKGISAAKGITIAINQNIPIYVISKENSSITLPQLQLAQTVKIDIKNAVNSGKIVTVAKNNINYNGWIGCWYIAIDPNTGSGSYVISGGLNGSWVDNYSYESMMWLSFFSFMLLSIALGMLFAGPLAVLLVPILIGLLQLVIANTIQLIYGMNEGISDITKETGAGAIMDIVTQIMVSTVLRWKVPIEMEAVFLWSGIFVDWIAYFKL